MCGIANDMDVMSLCEVEEWFGKMGKMAVNGKEASLPPCLILRLLMKILDIFQINLAVNPAFSGVPKSTIDSVLSRAMDTW
jgi:hypothetical protein